MEDLSNRIKILEDGIRKFLTASGHDLCHENRRELASLIGMDDTFPSLPPEEEFKDRCELYRKEIYKR